MKYYQNVSKALKALNVRQHIYTAQNCDTIRNTVK